MSITSMSIQIMDNIVRVGDVQAPLLRYFPFTSLPASSQKSKTFIKWLLVVLNQSEIERCPVPGRALEPNFTDKQYAIAYPNSLIAVGQFNSSESNGLTYHMFGNGFTLFAFDLTADNQVYAAHRHAIASCNVRLELSCGAALPETINILIVSVSDNTLEVTAERNVEFNYTI